jgi:hypothetical protein
VRHKKDNSKKLGFSPRAEFFELLNYNVPRGTFFKIGGKLYVYYYFWLILAKNLVIKDFLKLLNVHFLAKVSQKINI